jgi:hypothetical protein
MIINEETRERRMAQSGIKSKDSSKSKTMKKTTKKASKAK